MKLFKNNVRILSEKVYFLLFTQVLCYSDAKSESNEIADIIKFYTPLIIKDSGDPCANLNNTHFPLCKIAEECITSNYTGVFKNLCSDLNEDNINKKKNFHPTTAAAWGYGILCVTIISGSSILGVGLLPLMSKPFYNSFLTTLIGLAVGSLSGSALFHLIPSAFKLAEVEHFEHHSYLYISLVVWGGVYLFFIIERFLKTVMELKSRRSDKNKNHSKPNNLMLDMEENQPESLHFNEPLKPPQQQQLQRLGETTDEDEEEEEEDHGLNHTKNCGFSTLGNKELYEHSKQAMKASFGHMERPAGDKRPNVEDVSKSLKEHKSPIATVAWMIIFGDGVHNFIDGLSIGAAFSENILTGISVSIAVMCEELPHELGDFAVLLNSGMSMKQAVFYNFLSACTCYLGLILGILIGEADIGNEYIFALAGGMFLYIALVDMVPELNETADQAAKESLANSIKIFMLQNIGILTGIISLFILAKYQDRIQITF